MRQNRTTQSLSRQRHSNIETKLKGEDVPTTVEVVRVARAAEAAAAAAAAVEEEEEEADAC
jgi:hypothetical protein